MTDSLLPPNATALETALDLAIGGRIEAIEPDGIRTVGDPTACPTAYLPFLARQRHVDVYDPSWSETTRRDVIAAAPRVHRKKGTPTSIDIALAAMGITATVIERVGARKYDGATAYDGTALHGPKGGWAMYRVKLSTPLRNDQVAAVRALLATTAPVRCQLLSLDYTEVANLYDGRSSYDGAYNHGVAV